MHVLKMWWEMAVWNANWVPVAARHQTSTPRHGRSERE